MTRETRTIVVVSQKGGVGKTSLLQMLASMFAYDGAKVACVDSTLKQQHFYKWCEKGKLGLMYMHENDDEKLVKKVKALKRGGDYDFILIDTAGILTTTSSYMTMQADLILVPCDADPDSATDTVITVKNVNAALDAVDKHTPTFVVMNAIKTNVKIGDEVIGALDKTGVPRLRNVINDYTCFPRMKKNGFLAKGGNGMRAARGMLAELQNMDQKALKEQGREARLLLPYYGPEGGWSQRTAAE